MTPDEEVDCPPQYCSIGDYFYGRSFTFMLNMARANSWSWTTGIPTTVYSDEVSPNDDWNNSCASKFHNIRDQRKIEGVEDQSRQYNTECLIGSGDNYQLFEGNDGKLAVSFAGESNAHVINSGASCFMAVFICPAATTLSVSNPPEHSATVSL